jgi:hypothetical protein
MFVSDGLSTIGDQVARIAVALLVLERSGSTLAATATYAAPTSPGWSRAAAVRAAGPLPPTPGDHRLGRAAHAAGRRADAADLPLWRVRRPRCSSACSHLRGRRPQRSARRRADGRGVRRRQRPQQRRVAGRHAWASWPWRPRGGPRRTGGAARGRADFAVSIVVLLLLVRERRPGPPHAEEDESGTLSGFALVAGTSGLRTLLAWALLSAVAVVAADGAWRWSSPATWRAAGRRRDADRRRTGGLPARVLRPAPPSG